MDISPPTSSSSAAITELLHSVSLPFSKAVYAVGDSDSLVLKGILINGDTVMLDSKSVQWAIVRPSTTAIVIDSGGVLHVNSFDSREIEIRGTYQIGEVTRSKTARVFLTRERHDIRTFTLESLDSSRAGYMLGAFSSPSGLLASPKYKFSVLNADNERPADFPRTQSFVEYFATNPETNQRIPFRMTVNGETDLTLRNDGLKPGNYWIGFRSYLYGKSFADSVLFTSLPSAEIVFSSSLASDDINGAVTIVGPPDVSVQPCAFVFIRNYTLDTIVIEFSQPTHDMACGENGPESDPIIIPPLFLGGTVRQLGYSVGSIVTWAATAKGKPASLSTGTIHFVKNEDPESQ